MARDLINDLGKLATEEPLWIETPGSSNVGAFRWWKESPEWHVAVLEVFFHTSNTTYSYACPHQTYHAMLRAGSKGKFVHRNLIPRGYLAKRSGR